MSISSLYQAKDRKLYISSSSVFGGLKPIYPSKVDSNVLDASVIDKKLDCTLVVKLLLESLILSL